MRQVSEPRGGGGGGDSHMKWTGMLVVSLRGVNFGFLSRLGCSGQNVIREVKHDVYGKRQTAKIELLVSDFSRLYNLGKLFAFTVIKGFFSYFSTGFI